ncbi:putative cyclase [Thozetella sp. PMI_491]|nr:putative cyclase [Thozetella sp. PMI_491]
MLIIRSARILSTLADLLLLGVAAAYDQLPLDSTYPTKAAWGVWGADDEHGALNHITNQTVVDALSEVKLGLAIPINLQLDMPGPPPNPNRKPLTHLFQPGDGYTDDVVTMNTQVSTQYDGLRHFPYSTNNSIASYRWYNDLIASYDEVIGPAPTKVLGLQVAAQKGIAVRAVLLDWAGWMDSQNRTFDAFGSVDITPEDLDAVAAWQGLSGNWSKPGDMLIIRTGWLRQYQTLNVTQDALLPLGDGFSVGMEASDASAQWLWEKKLALVGADNPAFESLPMNKTIDGVPRSLHQIFIGGWGQSIVELLDLEQLATKLHEQQKFTFFVTIQTLNIVSGIASPPNAVAII